MKPSGLQWEANLPPPRGHLAMFKRFSGDDLRGCHWYLVSEGSYNVPDVPTAKNCLVRRVNSADLEKQKTNLASSLLEHTLLPVLVWLGSFKTGKMIC